MQTVFFSLSVACFLCFSSYAVAEKTDVYLAGPLFTLGEREFNAALAQRLRQFGYTVFLPQEAEPRELTSECLFSVDVGGVENARVLVAILDGPDPDSGTSWECGYAYARGKSIILVRTDFRGAADGNLAPFNIMLWESAVERVQAPCLQYNLSLLAEEIHKALQSILYRK
jgi:nucleoside 2-deoxyribosyltransferase